MGTDVTLREAAQRALEAIDRALPYAPHCGEFDALADMADALRAALAEPVQEPYAWMAVGGSIWRHKTSEDDVPLFTAPPQRKPLTEEEIYAAIKGVDSLRAVEVARAVERAHGIGGGGGGVA